jgi:chromosome segregation ATPase
VTKSRYNQIVACTADYCRFGGILATGADPSLVDEVERNIHDLQAVHDRKVEQVEMAKSAHEQLKEQSEGVRQEMKEAENELQRQKDTRNEVTTVLYACTDPSCLWR